MNASAQHRPNKVADVTLAFWITKILSTTVGETVADYLAVNAGLGMTLTTTLMCALLAVALTAQLRAHRFAPWRYWLVVVLVSVVGTQVTDLLTDRLEISLWTSTAAFALTLVLLLGGWFACERTLSIRRINTRRREWLYWSTILCTFALGTAAGDLATEAIGLGFQLGVVVFGALLGTTVLAWCFGLNPVLLFWLAYILTRPLGAALGDLLTQAPAYGGLGLGARNTSLLFLAAIIVLVSLAQRTLRHRASQP